MSDEYLDFDDLDNYVGHLFGDDGYDEDDRPADSYLNREERIDQIISDAYDEVIRWHNQQIAEGTDPGSGLHGLPPIPWDEKIDGVAAMMGACAPGDESDWRQYGQANNYREREDEYDIFWFLLIMAVLGSMIYGLLKLIDLI
jgi:hypothetical protein